MELGRPVMARRRDSGGGGSDSSTARGFWWRSGGVLGLGSCARPRRNSLGCQHGRRSCREAARRRRQAHRRSADGGGGVPGSGVGESENKRRERVAGLFVVLKSARDPGPGLCSELATASARWRPLGSAGARGTGRRGTVRGGCGSRGQGVMHGAAAKLELACGRPRAAGGRCTALAAGNRGADRRKKKRTGSQIQKISGTQL